MNEPIYPRAPEPVYMTDDARAMIAAQRRQPAPAPEIPSRPSPRPQSAATVPQAERVRMWRNLGGTFLAATAVLKRGGEAGRLAWADCQEALRCLQRAAARKNAK
jgi:hypothetical protein